MWDPPYNRGGILNENAGENAPGPEKLLSSLNALSNIRIILVEPSHPGNIGGAARAMKTMGLSDLALVNPGRYPDPQAEWRAAGAQDVLEAARVFESVEDAIADAQWVVGTSTRVRRIPWPLMKAEEAVAGMIERLEDQKLAVLFGRETSGLTNEELQKCHMHLVIPANPEYSSLNLAMAVQVVCYEIYRQFEVSAFEAGAQGRGGVDMEQWDRSPATSAQLEGLIGHFERVLIDSGFLDPGNPGQTMTRLRRLLTRVTPDETEVQMLRGILKELDPGSSGG
jgi:tRNA (cytidine32/uridine32-2'-O)-methyltransferase